MPPSGYGLDQGRLCSKYPIPVILAQGIFSDHCWRILDEGCAPVCKLDYSDVTAGFIRRQEVQGHPSQTLRCGSSHVLALHCLKSGTEEMAQWVKLLVHSHKDPSSDPQNIYIEPDAVLHVCNNPRASTERQEVEIGGSPGACQQASPAWGVVNKGLDLKQLEDKDQHLGWPFDLHRCPRVQEWPDPPYSWLFQSHSKSPPRFCSLWGMSQLRFPLKNQTVKYFRLYELRGKKLKICTPFRNKREKFSTNVLLMTLKNIIIQ